VDIADPPGVASALEGAEVIVHLAVSPGVTWDRAQDAFRTNVLGALNVFEAARANGARRVINASSINVFGTFYERVSALPPVYKSLPLAEDDVPLPEDPYSLTKLMTEAMAGTFARVLGVESVNLRFSGVWKPEMYEAAHEFQLIRQTESWKNDLFTWVHVFDVVQALKRAAEAPSSLPLPMTIASSDTCAPEKTFDLLDRLRPELVPHLREPLEGRASLLSISRARISLGYEPAFTLNEAFARAHAD
jgi:nucleoside-diphosphate-sugar epimerase